MRRQTLKYLIAYAYIVSVRAGGGQEGPPGGKGSKSGKGSPPPDHPPPSTGKKKGPPRNRPQCLNLPINSTFEYDTIDELYESVDYSLDELLFETLNGSSLGGFDDVLENNGNGGANSCRNNAIRISASGPELEDDENADPYYRFDETYDFPVTLNVTLDLNDEDQHDILLSGMPVLVQIASLPNLNGTDDLMIQKSSSMQINLADHGEVKGGIFRAIVPVKVPHEVVYSPNFISTSSSLLESVVFTTAARVVLLTDLNNNDEDGESEDLYQVRNA